MFTNDEHLGFLQRKIAEIKIALFKAEIKEAGVPLPNNIISTFKTDMEGNVWFFTSCNAQFIRDIKKDFHASLDYYQKGGAYRLQVTGRASIIHDAPGISNSNVTLVKLKILHAEYFENKLVMASSSLKTRVKDFFSKLFLSHNYREFNFS
jgi:general stress protein 26